MTKSVDSLPYVDGIPNEFQKRIDWIKNTEPLNGATTRYGNDGELNRSGVQLQENIVSIHNDLEKVSESVDNSKIDIKQIQDSLQLIGEDSAIEQVYINKKNIEVHDAKITKLETDTSDLRIEFDFLDENVGQYDPTKDDYYRTVRDNIVFVKKEMGAYPGQDMNGQPKQDTTGSGMKYRIINNAIAIVSAQDRIKKLEDDYAESDVGQLSVEVSNLRKEVGPKIAAGKTDIYTRLAGNNESILSAHDEIYQINEAIDFTNKDKIGVRVGKLETSVKSIDLTLNQSNNGIVPRVGSLEVRLGNKDVPASIEGRINTIQKDQIGMADIIGRDTSSGLQGQVSWINATVGIVPTGQPVPTTSVLGRLNTVEDDTSSQQGAIQDIQVELGNNNEGLKGSVFTLQTQMNGDFVSSNPVARDGVYGTVVELHSKMATTVPDVTTADEYVRTKGQWVRKTFAIGQFTKNNFDLDLTDNVTIDPNTLTPADFNKGITNINDIVINDSGVFCVETDMILDVDSADKNVSIAIFINNVEKTLITEGVKAVSGVQVIKASKLIKVKAGDKVRFVVRSGDATTPTITIKSFEVIIHPAA